MSVHFYYNRVPLGRNKIKIYFVWVEFILRCSEVPENFFFVLLPLNASQWSLTIQMWLSALTHSCIYAWYCSRAKLEKLCIDQIFVDMWLITPSSSKNIWICQTQRNSPPLQSLNMSAIFLLSQRANVRCDDRMERKTSLMRCLTWEFHNHTYM